MATKFSRMLVPMSLALFLTACAGTPGTVTAGKSEDARKARCAGWPNLTFSYDLDTPETVNGILVYHRVGQKKKCWK